MGLLSVLVTPEIRPDFPMKNFWKFWSNQQLQRTDSHELHFLMNYIDFAFYQLYGDIHMTFWSE